MIKKIIINYRLRGIIKAIKKYNNTPPNLYKATMLSKLKYKLIYFTGYYVKNGDFDIFLDKKSDNERIKKIEVYTEYMTLVIDENKITTRSKN